MVKLSYIIDRIRDVKLSDYLSIFPMTAALILKFFYKNKYKEIWLICEEPAEARDNGYHFFKYMCEKQPQQKCVYAIKRESADAKKVQKLGSTIEYGSIQHWIAYFLCEYNISSQKGGKPNASICAFMELAGKFKTQNIFLQHGVIINDMKWLYADKSKIDFFVTSTIPETNFVKENFGYPQGVIHCTGLPRFDALHDAATISNRILVMPTWRYWFNLKSKEHAEIDSNFAASEYLKKWTELLDSENLGRLIENQKVEVIFYLHRNLQRYSQCFGKLNNSIKVAEWEKYDIQDLLKSSSLMVTDYSSVFFDMVYMQKPVVFYQFDEKEYRKYQYGQGYFDYHDNPFAKTYTNAEEVIEEMNRIVRNRYKVDADFEKNHRLIFKYYDKNNSRRIFDQLWKK